LIRSSVTEFDRNFKKLLSILEKKAWADK